MDEQAQALSISSCWPHKKRDKQIPGASRCWIDLDEVENYMLYLRKLSWSSVGKKRWKYFVCIWLKFQQFEKHLIILILVNMVLTVFNPLILTPIHWSRHMGSRKGERRPGEGRGCSPRSTSHNTRKDGFFINDSIWHGQLIPTGQAIVSAMLQQWHGGTGNRATSSGPYSWWGGEPEQGVRFLLSPFLLQDKLTWTCWGASS